VIRPGEYRISGDGTDVAGGRRGTSAAAGVTFHAARGRGVRPAIEIAAAARRS
jgi:hypothetical protein